jgi:hypothetical protein
MPVCHLLKLQIFVEPQQSGQEIEDIVVTEGNPILSDMIFSTDGNYLFAMTSSSVG